MKQYRQNRGQKGEKHVYEIAVDVDLFADDGKEANDQTDQKNKAQLIKSAAKKQGEARGANRAPQRFPA